MAVLILYVVAAIVGGLATLGTGWSAFGFGALLLTPFGASLAVLAIALLVGLTGVGSHAEEEGADLTDHLVGSLRRAVADAAPPSSARAVPRKRAG